MSEVAGTLSIEAAGAALKRYAGGRSLLIGGVPGVQPARIVVIGGGVVGTHAARMGVGLGPRSQSLIVRFLAFATWTSCSKVGFVPGYRQSMQLKTRYLRQTS